MRTVTVDEAVDHARHLLRETTARVVIGIAGAPGAGKSHLAATLQWTIPGTVVVGMDGWHLAHSTLTRRGLVERKGAPETFDADGYVALLARIRHQGGETIWAPEFRREIEDAIAGAVEISPDARLVLTEGNYLLLDEEPWSRVRGLCDEVWYLDPDEERRVEQLVGRHLAHGRTPQEATARATWGTDAVNAALVRATRQRAHLVVTP